jgi:hypothetical protein
MLERIKVEARLIQQHNASKIRTVLKAASCWLMYVPANA